MIRIRSRIEVGSIPLRQSIFSDVFPHSKLNFQRALDNLRLLYWSDLHQSHSYSWVKAGQLASITTQFQIFARHSQLPSSFRHSQLPSYCCPGLTNVQLGTLSTWASILNWQLGDFDTLALQFIHGRSYYALANQQVSGEIEPVSIGSGLNDISQHNF